jgi:hypothetical protein
MRKKETRAKFILIVDPSSFKKAFLGATPLVD